MQQELVHSIQRTIPKQTFSTLNPREETRTWNPLSLGSGNTMLWCPIKNTKIFGHLTQYLKIHHKHIGLDLSFLQQGNADSPLGKYAEAIRDGDTGKFVEGTAQRTTNAHLLGLVPGQGGSVSIPALPEINLGLGGNINSLELDVLKYNKDRPYVLAKGTNIIPSENPKAGFKTGVLGRSETRYEDSPLTELFKTEDTIRQSGKIIQFPKSVTDPAPKDGQFFGNLYGDYQNPTLKNPRKKYIPSID